MSSFKELIPLIVKWGEEKGILEKSNINKQLLKTHEEVNELINAFYDNNVEDIKDAIGDIQVTLILAAKFVGVEPIKLFEDLDRQHCRPLNINTKLAKLMHEMYIYNFVGFPDLVNEIINKLNYLGYTKGLTLEQCLESAYNVISKRKGKMVNGIFVKEQ